MTEQNSGKTSHLKTERCERSGDAEHVRLREDATRQILLSDGTSLLTINYFSTRISACASLFDPML